MEFYKTYSNKYSIEDLKTFTGLTSYVSFDRLLHSSIEEAILKTSMETIVGIKIDSMGILVFIENKKK